VLIANADRLNNISVAIPDLPVLKPAAWRGNIDRGWGVVIGGVITGLRERAADDGTRR
jgi:hypothetical protein